MKSNSSGFTILELMATIAIMGTIVAVAIPSYCKYASQAKQSQAKMILGSVYSAEMSFAIEQQSFTGCLKQLGVNKSQMGDVSYYAFGFNSGKVTASCGPNANASCFQLDWSAAPDTCSPGSTATNDNFYAADVSMGGQSYIPGNDNLAPNPGTPPATYVSQNTFFAMAVGNISSCNSSADRWYIDQNKNLSNINMSL